jgi:ABC-type maltose transport system permease subunit
MAYFGLDQITALLNTVVPLMIGMVFIVLLMRFMGSSMEKVTAALT